MASEFWQRHRGELSSFFKKLELGLRPLSQAFLDLAEKTVATYPQLKGVVEAMKIDRLVGRGVYPPEPEVQAEMEAVKAAAARRHAESHRLHIWLLAASAAGLAGVAIYGWLQDSGILNSADVSALDNQPKSTEIAPAAEAVEAYTATPTGTPSRTATNTETATATEAATETPEPTATPTATERLKPTEKPLPGELFKLDCRELPWSKCWEALVETLEPLLSQGGVVSGQSFSTVNDFRYNWGEGRKPLDYVVKRYYSPLPVGVFILDWTAPDGEVRSDEVFVFMIRENGKQTLVPVLPLSMGAGDHDNSVGIFWDVGIASADGVVMSSSVTTSEELAKKLFEEKRAVHDIAVIQETVNFQLGDPVAELFYSQSGSPEKGLQPIRLVVEFGLKPSS